MSDYQFSMYLSVKVNSEFNNEEIMETIYAEYEEPDGTSVTCDKEGIYGLRYHCEIGDSEGEISIVEYEEAKVMLRQWAKDVGIKLDEMSWKIQAANWYDGADCPLVF